MQYYIFLDDKDVYFDGVENKYIKKNNFLSFCMRVVRKAFGITYIRLPYYDNLNFDKYDVVLTEGVHYPFLKYFENYNGKLILNDSITAPMRIERLNIKLINRLFDKAVSVVVNDKIPILYKKNGIRIETKTIGHTLQIDKITFIEREKFNGKIISIGRLVEEKGFIFIIRAIMNLLPKYPFLRLDIYGDGPLKNDLNKFIRDNNLENHIRIKKTLKYDELIQQFKKYELFISHPLEMSHIAEAFHMSNMEAMTSGLPVITTNCGGIPSVVKEFAIVNSQKDIKSLGESIERLYERSDKYNQMSVNGRKFIEENYSLNININKWIDVLGLPIEKKKDIESMSRVKR